MRTQKDAIAILEKAYAACNIAFDNKVADAYLYGSYAREEQHEYSDVDIMILVDMDDEELARHRHKVAVIASDLSLEQDITVSITAKSAAQFNRYSDVVPFYANIIKEGIRYADTIDITMDFRNLLNLLKTATSVEEIEVCKERFVFYISQIKIMFGFDQRNQAHQFDLWFHSLHTVLNLPKNTNDPMIYLAALLHDIGKPDCQCHGKRPDDLNMHYYGHPRRSMEIVRDEILPALAENGVLLTSDEQRRLLYYVEYHDDRVSLEQKHLLRHLQMASLNEFKNLMRLQVADAEAHVMLPIIKERIRVCKTWASSYADQVYQQLLDKERGKCQNLM